MDNNDKIAVLVPCYNEALTIAKVVADFSRVLPGATIYVFDNNSTDDTAREATKAGAIVVPSPLQGKGNVVRHMFKDISADIYLLVDGDDTYPASAAYLLIEKFSEGGCDMVVGARLVRYQEGAFRRFHRFGNHLVARMILTLFHVRISDVLSGYRVFSREFVKTLPLTAGGFEIETEMTLQAAAKGFLIEEIPIDYGIRPDGSLSKLSTFRDGYLIIKTIVKIFKDYKPLPFFLSLSAIVAFASLLSGFPPLLEYIETRYVAHVPLAILAAALGVLSCLFLSVGLILDTLNRYQRETFEMIRGLKNVMRRQSERPPSRL
jgi:glycosyltransferase involved in cell wall biosynthesis